MLSTTKDNKINWIKSHIPMHKVYLPCFFPFQINALKLPNSCHNSTLKVISKLSDPISHPTPTLKIVNKMFNSYINVNYILG